MFSSESAEALGARWNAIGREHAVRMSDLLAAFHEGRVRKFKFDSDPRDINMASRVADHVKRLNESGRWQDARKLFDPAHEPFIPLLDKFGENLPCAVILGPDEFLVRTGTSYKPGKTLHLTPSGARELPDILAFAISRDHNALLLVTVNGFTTSHDLSGPTIAHMPWPAGPPRQIDSLCVANGGRRVAFADEELGMWVGTASSSGPVWVEMRPAEASPTEPVEDKL